MAVSSSPIGVQAVDCSPPRLQSYQLYTNSMLFCMVTGLSRGICEVLQVLGQQQSACLKNAVVVECFERSGNLVWPYLFLRKIPTGTNGSKQPILQPA
jgi:hypothetical protein